jgi:hypothetical protein
MFLSILRTLRDNYDDLNLLHSQGENADEMNPSLAIMAYVRKFAVHINKLGSIKTCNLGGVSCHSNVSKRTMPLLITAVG